MSVVLFADLSVGKAVLSVCHFALIFDFLDEAVELLVDLDVVGWCYGVHGDVLGGGDACLFGVVGLGYGWRRLAFELGREALALLAAGGSVLGRLVADEPGVFIHFE